MTPQNYYDQFDQTIIKLSGLLDEISKVEEYARRNNLRAYWRGQADYRWPLTSSLVRHLTPIQVPDDKLLNHAEDKTLKESVKWVKDLQQHPYQKELTQLTYMQHHGVPTRLLDFTKNAWVGLFFAVETMEEIDGRLFALLVDETASLNEAPQGTPWRQYQSNEVKIWDPAIEGISFDRLNSQSGVFALGRLPSTRPHRTIRDDVIGDHRAMLAEEVRRVLSIPFKLVNNDPIPDNAKAPFGLTFRVHIDKQSCRKDLAGKGGGRKICPIRDEISHRTMYPDIDGLVNHSELLKGLRRGVLLP